MTTRDDESLKPTREELIAFLRGIGEIEGCTFGEKPAYERGMFWWRKYLPILSSQPSEAAIENAALADRLQIRLPCAEWVATESFFDGLLLRRSEVEEIIRALLSTTPAEPVKEGYVLVPVEPTSAMVVAGFESWPDEHFSQPEEWEAFVNMSGCEKAAHKAKLCYAAMIAASPTQSMKDE